MSIDATVASPPRAPEHPHVRRHHGDEFVDPFHWLSQAQDPAVLAHLAAENEYTAAVTAGLAPLAETLYAELRQRIKETDVSVPVRDQRWWYFTRTREGQQYASICRVADTGELPEPVPEQRLPGEEIVLDVDAEAAGHEFFSVADVEVDRSGTRLAFTQDRRGDERFDVVVRLIGTGTVLDDAVRMVGEGLAWAPDGSRFYYVRVDEAWRPFQVWVHELGADCATDVLVHEEPDALFTLGFELSRDGQWLTIQSQSRTSSEVRLLDLRDRQAEPVLVHPRQPEVEVDVEVDGDRILLVHNAAHPDFELAWAPLASPQQVHWRTILPGRDGERIVMAQAFATFTAVARRQDGLARVCLVPRTVDGYGPPRAVEIGTEAAALTLCSTPEYRSTTVRVRAESFVQPESIYDVDGATGQARLLRQQQVPGYDPSRFCEQRLWVTARDGAAVPLSVVYRSDVHPDATNAGVITGYGSYEVCMEPYFSAGRVSLLERGVVCAMAHVRGGGELGRQWYEGGRMLRKRNTFQDFVDCSRALIELGWVAPDRLAAEGGSAGGLLIGAVVNEAPEVYRAVHAAVPFVDALTTILNPELPLTVGEWEEWGNPLADPEVYAYMKSYTPYENVRATQYPTVLATSSLHDTRVFVAEPAKWVQQLRRRTTATAERPVLLQTEMGGGHGGPSGRYDHWRRSAFENAVLLDAIGASQLR